MFLLLSKSYLILNELDFKPSDNKDQTNRCLVFSLKDDATEPLALGWPPAAVSDDGEDAQQKQPSRKAAARVNCGCVSPSEEHIALCDENKNLFIFNRNFEVIRHFVVRKNFVKIRFKSNEQSVFGCDKAGDFYEFDYSANNPENSDKLLLGHCSMLLDFAMSKDDKYVISCDRDEKIRVSNYPNTYNVQRYCLGHEQFVSSVQLLDQSTLLSGSGDGNLILWDFLEGKQVSVFNCDHTSNESNGPDTGSGKSQFPIKCVVVDQEKSNYVAVSFYKQPLIYVLKVVRDGEQASLLQLVDKFSLDAEPIWIQFDAAHCNFLWVFGGSKTKPVELFELKQDKLEKAFSTLKIVDALNESQQLRAAFAQELEQNPVEGLFKHHFNNVEAYLERKQLRIENENKKRFV